MSDKITDNNKDDAARSDTASMSAASAFREESWDDTRILINRPEPGTSEAPAATKSALDSKSIGGALGGDIKHGIVTTYDEDGNPTSDCFGPIPRPIKGIPIAKPGGLGTIKLPPIELNYPKK
jgi:hypothetical protein